MSSIARLGILSSRVLKPQSLHANQVRHGGDVYYRRSPWESIRKSSNFRLGQGIIFVAFIWMFSGLYTHEGRQEFVLGHAGYTDPSKWTDEELGIPPDDEDV